MVTEREVIYTVYTIVLYNNGAQDLPRAPKIHLRGYQMIVKVENSLRKKNTSAKRNYIHFFWLFLKFAFFWKNSKVLHPQDSKNYQNQTIRKGNMACYSSITTNHICFTFLQTISDFMQSKWKLVWKSLHCFTL